MAVSNVYYTNMRTTLTENLLQKLERLVKKAGMMDIDFNNKYTCLLYTSSSASTDPMRKLP